RMVGAPDGLGAFPDSPASFTLMMNHELPAGAGIVRGTGASGAFVSQWTIDRQTLAVLRGADAVANPSQVQAVDGTRFVSFCSGTLPAAAAFLFGGVGTDARRFLHGAETR